MTSTEPTGAAWRFLQIRLTAREYELLGSEADHHGCSRTALIRSYVESGGLANLRKVADDQ